MAISHRYCDFATGNDYIGASFTDGAFTVADMTLTKTGAFTLNKANHWLYLTDNGSGRVTAGYYKIASVTSANAVVLASSPKSGATDPTDVVCTAATGGTAAPFRSVQGALDLIARDATNGNQINIKAGTAQALAASIVLTTYGTPTTTTPLVFRGYTSAADDGGIGDLDGGGAVSVFNVSAADYVWWIDLHLHNVGAREVVLMRHYGGLYNCEVDTNSAAVAVTGNVMMVAGCHIHDVAYGINLTGGVAIGNYVSASSICMYSQLSTMALNNICVVTANGEGIRVTAGGSAIGNSVYASSASTGVGILLTGQAVVVANNIVQGFSGAGGDGIDAATKSIGLYAANAFYNSTSNQTNMTKIVYDINNDVLGASPFVSAGTDFDINGTVTGVTEDGFPSAFKGLADTTPKPDKGASQAGAGAGGGGGKPSYGDRSGGKF